MDRPEAGIRMTLRGALWLAIAFALIAFGARAQTGSASLTCTAPTKNTDGSSITGAVTYQFYHGTSATSQTDKAPIQTTCAYVWAALAAGTHYFTVTAIVGGQESVKSAAASKVIVAVPNPPTNLTVTDPTAYKQRDSVDGSTLVAIGTVPVGTPCDRSTTFNGKYLVPRAKVTMASPFDTLPLKVWATCG